MRVLFNLLDAGVGGGQQVALDIASELVRRGHSIGVVVPAPGPATRRFAELGAPTHTAHLVSLRRPGFIPGARIARRYDLVYSHTSVPGEILGGLAAGLAGRPHAVHRHVYPHFSPSPSIRAVQHFLYRHVERRARSVAVARHVAESMVEVGIPRDRIEVIPNGVEVPSEPAPIRLGDGPVRFGLLGRLDPQKGGDLFVQAASRIGGDAEFLLGAPGLTDDYGRCSARRRARGERRRRDARGARLSSHGRRRRAAFALRGSPADAARGDGAGQACRRSRGARRPRGASSPTWHC